MPEAIGTLLRARSANKPYRWTRLNGRQTVWTEELVKRLAILWEGRFHHDVIATVLDVGPRAACTKASRVGLPARGHLLSKDLDAAIHLDEQERRAPKVLRTQGGREVIGRYCNLSGHWFYGLKGTHTSPEAKLTVRYQEGA